jgi:hypothetical protein
VCGPVSANALNHVCVRVCVCVCECMCVFVRVCGCLCMWAWECRCSYHWRKNFGRRCRPFLVSINISEHKRALTIIFARLSWRALRIARSMHTRRARSIHTASTHAGSHGLRHLWAYKYDERYTGTWSFLSPACVVRLVA